MLGYHRLRRRTPSFSATLTVPKGEQKFRCATDFRPPNTGTRSSCTAQSDGSAMLLSFIAVAYYEVRSGLTSCGTTFVFGMSSLESLVYSICQLSKATCCSRPIFHNWHSIARHFRYQGFSHPPASDLIVQVTSTIKRKCLPSSNKIKEPISLSFSKIRIHNSSTALSDPSRNKVDPARFRLIQSYQLGHTVTPAVLLMHSTLGICRIHQPQAPCSDKVYLTRRDELVCWSFVGFLGDFIG